MRRTGIEPAPEPDSTAVGGENTTSVPSGEGTGGADERSQAQDDRNKRNGGQAARTQMAPTLTAVALRAAAQRLRDDAADPLLPDLAMLVLGAGATSGQQRAVEQALVRQVSPQDLAGVWSEAARLLERLAERLNRAADRNRLGAERNRLV